MTRRSLFRVLLSMLLLLSQQMALSHAMSHWSGTLGSALHQDAGSSLASAFAQDPTCNQCLAFAQIAGALGSPDCRFGFAAPGACAPAFAVVQGACRRTVCPFQQRAPPVSV